jgi:molecular chaperone GrpE
VGPGQVDQSEAPEGRVPPSEEDGDAAPPEHAGAEPKGPTILADVAALTAERDEYLTDLQRLKADFDNYRKRVQRLQEEQAARGATDLVTKLLPVLDNLDLAQAHLGGQDGADSEEGRAFGQLRSQVLDVLAKEGLERVDEADVPFDPTVHDAVAHAPGDGEDEVKVEEVMRAGYRWRGNVLRPAMVRVRG